MNAPEEAVATQIAERKILFCFGLPFYIGVCFLSGLLAITIYDPDVFEFLYIIAAVPVAAIFFWAYSSYNTGIKRQSALLVLLVCCLVSWAIVRNSFDVRSEARWLAGGTVYKRQVLSQTDPPEGQFKHIVWDRWGWAGIGNTDIYLVYDPVDSLSAARKNTPGKLNGIPCEVPNVHRLERHWYTVTFYTDTGWDSCT